VNDAGLSCINFNGQYGCGPYFDFYNGNGVAFVALIDEDIINAWEILAEPIQMVARKHNISNSYELLKKNTRGKAVTKDVIHNLIKSLKIPDVEKKQLFDLTPKKYIGYAVKLCNEKY